MRKAKLFQNGQSQAVRLPKAFRFKTSEVFIKKQGDSVILTPIDHNPWGPFLHSLKQFSEDFMMDRAQPPHQKREDLF